MKSLTKKSFQISLYSHGVAFLGLLLFTLVGSCQRTVEHHVFTMVSEFPDTGSAQKAGSAEPIAQPKKAETKTAAVEKPSIPQPKKVEKVTEKKAIEKPQAKPVESTKVVKKEAVEKPKEAELKKVSYKDFVKVNEKKFQKVAQTNQKPTKPTNAPKLDVDGITKELNTLASRRTSSTGGAKSASGAAMSASVLGPYIAHIRESLDGVWEIPTKLVGVDSQTIVSFHVHKNGNVSQVKLLKSSGNSAFDASIVAAFRKLSQLSPPPGSDSYTFQLTFRMEKT